MPKSKNHLVIPNFTRVSRAYFNDVIKPAFHFVAQTTQSFEKTYRIANKTICLMFYHKKLHDTFIRALAHLETETKEPDLTVHLWDSVSTQTWIDSPFEHASFESETETHTNKHLSDEFLGIFLSGEQTLNLYDVPSKTAYFWTRDANKLPDWLGAAPIRPILHWFLSESNIHLIHGAVIGNNDQAILLSAKGGSGKSTTAISSILSGMHYLGDDYVGIESGEQIIAHSLYNSAKLDDQTIALFPELTKHISNPTHKPEDKSIVYFTEIFPSQIKQHTPLAAIMIPRVVKGGPTRVIPTTKLEAMLALSPTSLFQLPLAQANQLQSFKQIIEKTPCFVLELGLPCEEVPNVLKQFLKQISV